MMIVYKVLDGVQIRLRSSEGQTGQDWLGSTRKGLDRVDIWDAWSGPTKTQTVHVNVKCIWTSILTLHSNILTLHSNSTVQMGDYEHMQCDLEYGWLFAAPVDAAGSRTLFNRCSTNMRSPWEAPQLKLYWGEEDGNGSSKYVTSWSRQLVVKCTAYIRCLKHLET